jgi:hypothetical protein
MTDTETTQQIQVVERIYWTVPGNYSPGPEFATFEEAVAAAREKQQRIDIPQIESEPRWSRACVALRQSCRYAPIGTASGNDSEILRWEVYPDRVALVPKGQGGLSTEQAQEVINAKAGSKGWA